MPKAPPGRKSPPPTMPKAARATPRRGSSLPDEIVVWEILIRLPPKSVLRCRAVCRAWRRVTSARAFLLAHHGRQPALPIFYGENQRILAFDRRAATKDDQLLTVAQLDEALRPVAYCDGLLVLSRFAPSYRLSICNPTTREHALLGIPPEFNLTEMYLHRPTGEYRLLLRRRTEDLATKDRDGFYVFSLGSDQPPRYIGWPEIALGIFSKPVRLNDSLHWYPVRYQSKTNPRWDGWESKLIVFDTITESVRQMRAPIVPGDSSYIFEADGMLSIFTRKHSSVIDIRVLRDYETEVWDLKYRIELPVADLRMKFEEVHDYRDFLVNEFDDTWEFDVIAMDSGVLLLVFFRWLIHVDTDGKLVNSFYRGRRGGLRSSECWLKQSLVQHTFFPTLDGYSVNASPFIGPVE